MNNFIWADLSTYDPHKSKAFYKHVFGWQFHDAQGYHVAMHGTAEVIGLYETPDFFKKIKMPHFWMSYIEVENAHETAAIAKGFHKAKVELIDEFYGGNIALIRDPQGAGFTVYDGGKLNCRTSRAGHLIWNELHVSDATDLFPFYERLFSWKIKVGKSDGHFNIYDSDKKHIADCQVVPDEIKGKYEYWVCTFAVDNLAKTIQQIEQAGGGIVMDEGQRILVHDNSGEAFFYVQSQ